MLDVLLYVGYKVTHFFPIMFRYVVFFELVGESEGMYRFAGSQKWWMTGGFAWNILAM
jgi:hypothetical protein